MRAVDRHCPDVAVRVWARREEVRRQLRDEAGLVDGVTDSVADAIDGVDAVVLAMPTGSMVEVAEQMPVFPPDRPVVVTDVGSVKVPVMGEIAPLVEKLGARFVGSHPMAGSEKSGLEHADGALFQDAAVILTPPEAPDHDRPGEEVQLLRDFWEALGGRVTIMTAEEHDRLVASISHLPHLVAAALVRVALSDDQRAADFCGGGFRDTTRVSSGPEAMWSGILADNHRAVSEGLSQLIGELESWKEALDSLDRDRLCGFLSEARRLRETL